MENLDLPSTNSKMGNGTFCPSRAFFLLFLFAGEGGGGGGGGGGGWGGGGGGVGSGGGGVWEGLLLHFILSKIVDCRGSAIFVTYCTLKTR